MRVSRFPVMISSYSELEGFLRNYHNGGDPQGHYDANGILHLIFALLDNLRLSGGEEGCYDEFFEVSIHSDQLRFLGHIVDVAQRGDAVVE